MSEYTVIGAGAIGGTLAFHLARAGHAVTAVDADAEHIAAIRESGLRIRRPDGRVDRQDLPALPPGEHTGPLNAVILAVKAQATRSALEWAAPRLAPGGYVVSMQNGLCEPWIAEAVGADRTVAAFVNLFADLVAPGLIADGGPGALVVGETDGTISTRVTALVADLQAWGPAVAHANVAGHLWSKLAYSVVAAASATVDAPVADTIDRHRELTVALAREVYAVAAAEGVRPESFDAWRAAAFTPGAEDTDAALDAFTAWLRTQPKDRTGIWRDLAVRRRKTEVPALLEPVVTLAARHGTPCPGVRAVMRIIEHLESGERSMGERNLEDLERSIGRSPS